MSRAAPLPLGRAALHTVPVNDYLPLLVAAVAAMTALGIPAQQRRRSPDGTHAGGGLIVLRGGLGAAKPRLDCVENGNKILEEW
jgi:hypothetical protein